MSGTKSFTLVRPKMRKPRPSGWMALGAAFWLALALPLWAQRLPLPPDEQEAVNQAIRRGVDYLKRTQQKSGTWAKSGVGYRFGYAVLPGLTLLECGVPPRDPIIQQAARYLRAKARKLDTTYELSLGLLFLDRLGDPKDKKIIQTFALRLIAGQSATGGWGYKCLLLPPRTQKDLLIALRHLDPPPNGMPGIAGKPGGRPGIAGGPGKNPGDLAPIARGPDGPPLEGVAQQPGTPSLSGSIRRGSDGDSPSLSAGPIGNGLRDLLSPRELIPAPPDRWRDCLGLGILERRDFEPLQTGAKARADQKDAPARAEDDDKAQPPRSGKPYVIPPRLRMLTVVQDPALHILQDPRGQSYHLILTTTDNSNTQFAILALWTAQRYDVPMKRTLNLIVRRYVTSQNIDGSWNYHYRFGGAPQHEFFSSVGAMTCVGLIGLAVGHGLAQPVRAGQLVQDPRILKGLTALYQMIGKPSDRPINLPMQNLYFLWSVERVAVLYNLPTIGDKDWYRWGAQVLVANQQPQGNWAGGQYHGNSPTLDTCLALLFLKRANLVKDLTAKLPFKAADLNNGIMRKRTTPTAKPPEPPKKTLPSVEAPKAAPPEKVHAKPLSAREDTARPDTVETKDENASRSGGKTKWVVLSVMVFLLFAGGSLYFLFSARQGRDDEDEAKADKRKKRKQRSKS